MGPIRQAGIRDRTAARDIRGPVECAPGEVPITPEGWFAKEFFPRGRLAQSIAFFRQPGIERLYSGVMKIKASQSAMACLNARATAGTSAS